MCRKLFPLIALLMLHASVALCIKTNWYSGALILNDGEVLKGELNYNSSLDAVQLKCGKEIKAFSAFKVNSFKFYDKIYNIERYFKVFSRQVGAFERRSIYEIVIDGNISILRKEKGIIEFGSKYELTDISEQLSNYDYFSLSSDGNIEKLKKFKKNVVNKLMWNHLSEVETFIRTSRLSTYSLRDQFMIVDFYNSLKDNSYNPLVLKSR